MLGFDVAAGDARRLLDAARGDREPGAPTQEVLARRELEILDAFADLCALAPERRDPDADSETERAPREYLNTFLRSLDVEREGVPGWFGDALLRALAHYGVTELDRSPDLEAALLRIFIAHQRRDEQLPIVMRLLDDQLIRPWATRWTRRTTPCGPRSSA